VRTPTCAGSETGAPLLPEIAPDRIQQDAQPSGRAATSEKNSPAVFQRAQDRFLDLPCPARFHELAIFFHDVTVHVEKQLQRAGNVPSGYVAQVRCDGMRPFCDKRAKFELAADFQKFFGTFLRTRAHGVLS